MKTQEVEVTISSDGKITLHVQGLDGMQCLALTKDLENALGGQIIERRLTSEAFLKPGQKQKTTTRRSG